jgi:moderate conductance mechanosensitive channel
MSRRKPNIVDISAPDCAADAGSLCQWIWENTGIEVVARNSDAALSATLDILLILILAVVVRFLLYRAINRLTRLTISGSAPSALRPLTDQARRAFSRGLSEERRAQRTRAIGSLLKSISSFLVVSISAVLILAELGIDIAPLLASAGIAGVALAFGAQNLVRDFLAGIFMTLEDQYGIGDTVDLGSATGTVIAVTLRTTTVRAADGTIWHVRNGEVLRVGNSSQGEAVVSINLPIPYDADADAAGAIALREATAVAESEEFAASVVQAPNLLGIVDVSAGIVTIGLSVTIRAGDQDGYLRAVRAAIKAAFDAALTADPPVDFRPPLLTPPTE